MICGNARHTVSWSIHWNCARKRTICYAKATPMSVIDDLVTSSRCLGENTTTTTMEDKKNATHLWTDMPNEFWHPNSIHQLNTICASKQFISDDACHSQKYWRTVSIPRFLQLYFYYFDWCKFYFGGLFVLLVSGTYLSMCMHVEFFFSWILFIRLAIIAEKILLWTV